MSTHASVDPEPAHITMLRDLVTKLRIPQVWHKLYDQCLTRNEQLDYDSDCDRYGGPIPLDLWIARRRRISHQLAIAHLAYRADLLSLSNHDWLAREIGEEFPIDWEIQHAVSLGGLVIVDHPRTVFWEGLQVRISWQNKPKMWGALLELAKKARINAALTEADLYRRAVPTNAALANVIGRLKRRLPPTLSVLIRSEGDRSHQLHLDADRIRIFNTARRARAAQSSSAASH